jgi:hypothetical protein
MHMAGHKPWRDIKRKRGKQTEETRTGFEVPIPERGEFFSNLKKIAGKPDKGSATRRPDK